MIGIQNGKLGVREEGERRGDEERRLDKKEERRVEEMR